MQTHDVYERLLSSAARAVHRQLFLNGPTWDGDIASKQGRGGLFDYGLAARYDGWSYLTKAGVRYAIARGLDREKERRG